MTPDRSAPDGASGAPAPEPGASVSRRQALTYGLLGLAGVAGVGALSRLAFRSATGAPPLDAGPDASPLVPLAPVYAQPGAPGPHPQAPPSAPPKDAPAGTRVPLDDAPREELWQLWCKRGWAKEAYHYKPDEGRDVQCLLCPNECRLEPNERGRCRNRVNWNGHLYTLAYADPCALHVDPIEKKPLFHFLPGARAFSLATAGCNLCCLNCQNWEISQANPEETKDPSGPDVRLQGGRLFDLGPDDLKRLSLPPADLVAAAAALRCPTIAYTYSEPTSYYEYMRDTAELARKQNIANLLISNGTIQKTPLVELCRSMDAANINLKCFTPELYEKLNHGDLETVLNTLQTLKEQGVWFEVTNLMVPTYTDDLELVKKMCGWLIEHLGPDRPLHFLRFFPMFKLTHLPPTPCDVLVRAREIARAAGLRYVYLGNVREVADASTTFCPQCKKAVVERNIFRTTAVHLKDNACAFCGTRIAGVWKTAASG